MSTETIMFIRDSKPRMATSTFTQHLSSNVSFQCCFTSTETIRLIRDREPWTSTSSTFALRPQMRDGLLGTGNGGRWGGGGGGGRKTEVSTADTARKRPERPWTAARTMEVLRRCPLAIAQRLAQLLFQLLLSLRVVPQ